MIPTCKTSSATTEEIAASNLPAILPIDAQGKISVMGSTVRDALEAQYLKFQT